MAWNLAEGRDPTWDLGKGSMFTKQRRAFLVAVLAISVTCLLCSGLYIAIASIGRDVGWWSLGPGRGVQNTLWLYGSEPTTLDPAMVQDASSATYVVELYSGLVTLNQELEIVPDLARSWEMNADGTVYTFHLREGATFHNGQPVTASDFQASFERACDPALGSPVALSYLGDIVGVPEVIRGERDQISGVRVLDELTLEITIDRPKAYFLSKLTYPVAFVVTPTGLDSVSDQLIGTGPFRLTQINRDTIELERNPSFYQEPARIERVRFRLSGGLPITMYETGQLDIAPVGVNDMERVTDPTNPLSQELVIVPGLSVQYVGLNVTMPPFDDVKVRQALVHATDSARLAQVVLKNMVMPAMGILPPGLPGFNPELDGLAYDPALARELMSASAYGSAGNLPPLVLHIAGDVTGPSRTIQALLAMWRDNLGIEVGVEAVDWPLFLAEVSARRYPMFFLGWVADYPDPHNFLGLLFSSGSAENHTAYANPRVDALLRQAGSTLDMDRSLQFYQEIEQMVVNDAAWVPLWHNEEYYLVKPYVKGVTMASTIVPWLRHVYLETN